MSTEAGPFLRRVHPRFLLMAPVCVRGEGSEVGKQVTGVTRDISEFGVFVTASPCLSVGNNVWVEVQLPRVGDAASTGLRLRATGTIVRLAGPNEQAGFAVQARFRLPGEL